MRVASFNINGVKARMPALTAWLDEARPDIALLQEIKSADDAVPEEPFAERGYNLAVHGQKGFNGVAILSKLPIEDVVCSLPGDGDDTHARWIEATVTGGRAVRVACLYAPNGNPAPGPKYDYKLAWMGRMQAHVTDMLGQEMPLILAGDYNVIPQDSDAASPEKWAEDALALPASRAALRRIRHLGLTDAVETRLPGSGHYTFWDYQGGAWRRGDGIRIDHLLLSPQAADLMTGAGIDTETRGGDKPSDHAPVWVEIEA